MSISSVLPLNLPTSNESGRFFSSETIFREGLPPHIGQSDARTATCTPMPRTSAAGLEPSHQNSRHRRSSTTHAAIVNQIDRVSEKPDQTARQLYGKLCLEVVVRATPRKRPYSTRSPCLPLVPAWTSAVHRGF